MTTQAEVERITQQISRMGEEIADATNEHQEAMHALGQAGVPWGPIPWGSTDGPQRNATLVERIQWLSATWSQCVGELHRARQQRSEPSDLARMLRDSKFARELDLCDQPYRTLADITDQDLATLAIDRLERADVIATELAIVRDALGKFGGRGGVQDAVAAGAANARKEFERERAGMVATLALIAEAARSDQQHVVLAVREAFADRDRLRSELAARPVATDFIDVVFDGPPEHEAGRFVEVEDPDGKGIKVGEWLSPDETRRRGEKKFTQHLWRLRIPMRRSDDGLKAALESITKEHDALTKSFSGVEQRAIAAECRVLELEEAQRAFSSTSVHGSATPWRTPIDAAAALNQATGIREAMESRITALETAHRDDLLALERAGQRTIALEREASERKLRGAKRREAILGALCMEANSTYNWDEIIGHVRRVTLASHDRDQAEEDAEASSKIIAREQEKIRSLGRLLSDESSKLKSSVMRALGLDDNGQDWEAVEGHIRHVSEDAKYRRIAETGAAELRGDIATLRLGIAGALSIGYASDEGLRVEVVSVVGRLAQARRDLAVANASGDAANAAAAQIQALRVEADNWQREANEAASGRALAESALSEAKVKPFEFLHGLGYRMGNSSVTIVGGLAAGLAETAHPGPQIFTEEWRQVWDARDAMTGASIVRLSSDEERMLELPIAGVARAWYRKGDALFIGLDDGQDAIGPDTILESALGRMRTISERVVTVTSPDHDLHQAELRLTAAIHAVAAKLTGPWPVNIYAAQFTHNLVDELAKVRQYPDAEKQHRERLLHGIRQEISKVLNSDVGVGMEIPEAP